MWAIALAIVSAAIGFIAKLVHDIRSEHEARRAIAAAIAGELGAYIRLLKPEKAVLDLRKLVDIPYETRKVLLPGLFTLPTGHPVFDRVSDKIGLLTPEAARGISEAYNIITSGRIMFGSFSTELFVQLPDNIQIIRINAALNALEGEIEGVRNTVTLLEKLGRQSFICYLFG